MSSHHVVREKQEPALLVLGMDTFTDELLGQLLEWSPTIITTDDTAEKLSTSGIKVDIIITVNDAVENLQSDIRYIRASENYAQAALNYLVDNQYPAVNIITDEFTLDNYLPFADRINLVIYCGNKKIYPVMSGFNKWKPQGEVIELLNTGDDLQFTALQKIGESQYQTVADGFFSLQFEQPYLFVAENIL